MKVQENITEPLSLTKIKEVQVLRQDMWDKPEKPVAIDPSQVVIGLYIWLDIPWDYHPFLYNRFMVRDEKQIAKIRAVPFQGHLYYYPDKSKVTPIPLADVLAVAPLTTPEPDAETEFAHEMARQNREQHDRQRQLRDMATRADRAWEQAARVTREAMLGMGHAPKQAGAQLLELSQSTASLISQEQEVLLHLLGDKEGVDPQFHALNVMTLSMLIGKMVGFSEVQLAELALGTLAHDIGKLKVPLHLLKSATRSRHEEEFYRQHGAYGVELAKVSNVFGATALSIIADHHEYLDGRGWPTGKTTAGPAVRIASLVDRYDRLCSPESPAREALMPTEALARLYRTESAKFDQKLLSTMIKLLGVYPPGTLVRLNDESLGLVVSPGNESLRPTVLIYCPELEKRDAPTIDLSVVEDLKIEEALRPSSLPADVLEWMNPRQRLSYFFSTKKTS
jgi:HD-GYP domain-containing protein (c-di-GMP phosphodiesterase class II)